MKMNTLNYIGCKHTLFNSILSVCQENIADMSNKTFMDLFAGTGTVGFNMTNYFNICNANDLEYYSYVINYALLKCNYTENIQNIIDVCNGLKTPLEGIIYNNFSLNPNCERMFFTNENAKKTDAIRSYIQYLLEFKEITQVEFYFVLASLLVSIDKVANTSCVYGAYLKELKKTAIKPLIIQPIHTKTDLKEQNNVYNELAETLVKIDNQYYDVIYIDPPYNQRQYSANYSPLNYIALYDESIVLTGKTALIKNYNKSDFCKKREVKQAFTNLIRDLRCNYIILSYNNEGLLDIEEIKKILLLKGLVKLYKIKYTKFKAQQNVDKKFVEEYIWVVDTTKTGNLIVEIEMELI
uniref:site-specific DNA-methyltransferase (adenine-specific) n=1 Tax=viral metagenome TaxID=1070528 RepID=A0A6C0IEA6_9ZZZZ